MKFKFTCTPFVNISNWATFLKRSKHYTPLSKRLHFDQFGTNHEPEKTRHTTILNRRLLRSWTTRRNRFDGVVVGIGRRDASQSSVITRASFVIHPSLVRVQISNRCWKKVSAHFKLLNRTILDRGYVKVEIMVGFVVLLESRIKVQQVVLPIHENPL